MQDLTSFTVPKGFRGRPAWLVQLWWMVQALLFRASPQVLYGWRRFLLRLFGAKVGKNVIVRPTVRITYPWKVSIGDNSWIGDEVNIYSLGPVVIGSNSVISQKSYLCTGSHDYRRSDFAIFYKPITIGDQVWIATDVFIAPGVEVGDGAVVGARSSVFNNLEGGFVYAGHPLKRVRKREETVESVKDQVKIY